MKKNNRNCNNCGKSVTTSNTSEIIFCSKECMDEYSKLNNNEFHNDNESKVVDKAKKNCEICENEFNINVLRQLNINGKNKHICGSCYKGLIHFSNNIKYLENAIKFLK